MKCFICNTSTKEKITPFSGRKDAFKKCKNVLSFRKFKKIKYQDLSLNSDDLNDNGYHLTCYKKFMPIPVNHREEFANWMQTGQNFSPEIQIDKTSSGTVQGTIRDEDQPITSHGAVVEPMDIVEEEQEENSHQLSSTNNSKNSKCVFCGCFEKKIKNHRHYPIEDNNNLKERIEEMLLVVNDEDLQQRIKESSSVYHSVCKNTFEKKSKRSSTEEELKDELWHQVRKIHNEAFNILEIFLENEILKNQKVYLFSDIFIRYKALLNELTVEQNITYDFETYRMDHLQQKILTKYGDVIAIEEAQEHSYRKIIYKIDMQMDPDLAERLIASSSDKYKTREVAYYLRSKIFGIGHKKPEKVDSKYISEGDCNVPEELKNFICYIIKGPNFKKQLSDEDFIRIKSICDDLIYIVNKGRVKPAKHMMLASSLKSLTGSKKVLTILNKYGHCVSYTVAEELETELTYSSYEDNSIIPAGITQKNDLCTHVAFDNYDRFVDTINGKETLHDTVGIIYQFKADENEESHDNNEVSINEAATSGSQQTKRRRRFDVIPREMSVYVRRPKAITCLHPYQYLESISAENYNFKQDAVLRDIIWAISIPFVPQTPMWIGFNSQTLIDNSEQQIVDYLPQINMSPTSFSAILETLKNAQDIARQCNQEYIIVTYDLAIARIAMKIQIAESPAYDNIFFNMGGFHIQMAFFKALGKYIDFCGIDVLLGECEILASGSVNGFINAKHFNRCKRIHPICAAVFQSLHFERFINENEELLDDSFLNDLIHFQMTECNVDLVIPIALKELLQKYQVFIQSTLEGKHGKTAKFYIQYVEFMKIYFRFSRSVRTSNFNLYIESLFEMADLFFIFNQANYARWILMYQRNLIDMRDNNSPLFQHFLRGAFGVKRTDKNMARAPVDLTLEQTINADAANTLTGISHFTNSISVRQRWALSHSIRTKIITKLLESINYTQPDDITHELESNRIAKDRKAFNDFSDAVKKSMNPFSPEINADSLFNITTGKAVSDQASEFLLNVREKGKEQKRKFIEECAVDESRFERAIKKNKILNFASESLKKSHNTNDGKQTTIRMERDIFGRLLGISLSKKIDMETCFKYPLSPFPPALTYPTGELFKTNKSALAKKMISSIETSVPRHIDVEIIDGFHLLHNLGPAVPQAFGKIAEFILKKICNTTALEIHLIFDRYLSPSIKDSERSTRKEDEIPFAITGPLQSRPTDFNKSLSNPKFKDAIVTFLHNHWTDTTCSSIIKDKKVFLTVEDKCFVYTRSNGIITRILDENYECYHEEADTRIFFHLNKCSPQQKIIIKSLDTDVLIICLGNIHKFKEQEVWITTKTNNEINYVNCTQLAEKLGSSVCRALPGFHAFTGCDYTAAFVRKGKIKAYNLLLENEEYQNMFEHLTNPEDINDKEKTDLVQRFTNEMYNVKNNNVNVARFELFLKFFASTTDKEKFYKGMINFNSNNIPPCWKTLTQKILRTIFVNAMWQNATEPICTLYDPTECGWQVNESSKLEPLWYIGPSAPLKVEEILSCQQNEEESEESEEERNDNFDDNDVDDY